MFDDPASLNGHDEAGALPADLAEVHRRLLRDGTVWRQREPDVARLARYVGSRVPRQAITSAAPLMKNNRGHFPMQTDNADITLPARSWPRKFVAGAMATVVVIFAIVIVNLATHRGNITSPGGPVPPTPTLISNQVLGLLNVTYTQKASSPIDSFVLGYDFLSPQHMLARIHADPQKIHSGDTLHISWEVNGIPVTAPDCCEIRLNNQSGQGAESIVPMTTIGQGSITIYYNTIHAFDGTFLVKPVPNSETTPVSTPTPVSTQCVIPGCFGPTPTPAHYKTPTPPPTPTPTPYKTPTPPPTPTPTPAP